MTFDENSKLNISRILVELKFKEEQLLSPEDVKANLPNYIGISKELDLHSFVVVDRRKLNDDNISFLHEMLNRLSQTDKPAVSNEEFEFHLNKVPNKKEDMDALLEVCLLYMSTYIDKIPEDMYVHTLKCLEKVKSFYSSNKEYDYKVRLIVKLVSVLDDLQEVLSELQDENNKDMKQLQH